ncbi:MAG: hypothetical protein QGH62_04000 [Nitrospinaceae bacterium]|nr:hypothetical protein [Nitrospinaceae bacterium]
MALVKIETTAITARTGTRVVEVEKDRIRHIFGPLLLQPPQR